MVWQPESRIDLHGKDPSPQFHMYESTYAFEWLLLASNRTGASTLGLVGVKVKPATIPELAALTELELLAEVDWLVSGFC